MKILHYSLGLSPYRTGGLTKYTTDLMLEQSRKNNQVYLLYPGEIRIINKKDKIIKNKYYEKIEVYEIINPLPVPLLEGIKDLNKYMESKDINVYRKFLEELNLDIIHIHTLMGLPKEFLEAAKEKKIRIVFTSHDYFGICPKVSLLDSNDRICEVHTNQECTKCCSQALSIKKITLMQSHIYKLMKDFSIIKLLRKKQKNKIAKKRQENEEPTRTIIYDDLFKYYYQMFELIDAFHFNSEIAYNTYKRHLDIKKYSIIPITHSEIVDKRVMSINNKNDCDIIRFAYFGGQSYEKGYFFLIKVLNELRKKYANFELKIFFTPNLQEQYVNIDKPYTYKTIDDIYNNIDCVIVPSRWNETFGFVVEEAIAHGTPVIASCNVGASMLIKNKKTGYVYMSENELKEDLESLLKNRSIISKMQQKIVDDKYSFNMTEHNLKIIKFYETIK